jgi:hypothetical protein
LLRSLRSEQSALQSGSGSGSAWPLDSDSDLDLDSVLDLASVLGSVLELVSPSVSGSELP